VDVVAAELAPSEPQAASVINRLAPIAVRFIESPVVRGFIIVTLGQR
jgi:hypothetical protein